MSFRWKIFLLVVFAITVATLVIVWMFSHPATAQVYVGRTVNFSGLVVDENGHPVPDAVVLLQIDYAPTVSLQMIAPGDSTGAPRPTDLSLTTDIKGRFEMLGQPGDRLQILDVKKRGYTWLVDYAWVGASRYEDRDNRVYLFGSVRSYIADPNAPPVFPIISEGSRTIHATSRGGSDRFPNGKVIKNQPWMPLIPSAGPDAPHTAIEIEHRIAQLFDAMPASSQAVR